MSRKGISLTSVLKKYSLNPEQITAIESIKHNKITVLIGAAGTAKSFTAVYAALRLLTADNDFDAVSLTRPMVTTEKMGFLPGTASDKFSPYLAPLMEFFNKFGDSGSATYESLVMADKVRERPLAFMRGTTIEDEILIADEAQNMTSDQMLMVLTRISKTGKLIITGDGAQDDLKNGDSGLSRVVALADRLPWIQVIEMKQNMRDPLIQEILDNW